jgi:hypothetical protein
VPQKNYVPKTRIVSSEGPRGRGIPRTALKDERAREIGCRPFWRSGRAS